MGLKNNTFVVVVVGVVVGRVGIVGIVGIVGGEHMLGPLIEPIKFLKSLLFIEQNKKEVLPDIPPLPPIPPPPPIPVEKNQGHHVCDSQSIQPASKHTCGLSTSATLSLS